MPLTVGDLIDLADEFRERAEFEPEILEKEVRMAQQPSWPFEYSIDSRELIETDQALYFAEGSQLGYLPSEVSRGLGWR